jgi:hypothetical protein
MKSPLPVVVITGILGLIIVITWALVTHEPPTAAALAETKSMRDALRATEPGDLVFTGNRWWVVVQNYTSPNNDGGYVRLGKVMYASPFDLYLTSGYIKDVRVMRKSDSAFSSAVKEFLLH